MGTAVEPLSYRSTYRRAVMVLLSLPVLVLVAAFAVYAAVELVAATALEAWILGIAGVTVLALLALLVVGFRIHRWTIGPAGVHIEEGPAVPFTGLRRQWLLPFAEITSIRRVVAGAEHLVEIETRAGRRHRLPRAIARGGHAAHADAAGHAAFVAALQAALTQGGGATGVSEGLSFWNRPAGLAVQAVLLILALAIAGLAGWALWLGASASGKAGQAVAIVLLLPVGAAWLLRRSWRRRREVLRRP
jgi:hypothetical protein